VVAGNAGRGSSSTLLDQATGVSASATTRVRIKAVPGDSNPAHLKASGQATLLQRLATDFQQHLLAVRTWLTEHEPQITAALGVIAAFALIQPQLERMRDRFEDTEWEYLLDRVDFATGVGLLVLLDREGADGIERVLEAALGCSEALPQMLDALESLEMSLAHRRQLTTGLRCVAARDYAVAVPLLMNAFEGLVSTRAKDIGLIQAHKGKKHRFTGAAGRAGTVGGIEDLLTIGQLGFDDAFADFLRIHVYGGEGDAFRHGIATEGFRRRALMVTIALLGWLSAVAPTAERPQPLRTLLFDVAAAEWGRLSVASWNAARQEASIPASRMAEVAVVRGELGSESRATPSAPALGVYLPDPRNN
jgi:hypothetical protein